MRHVNKRCSYYCSIAEVPLLTVFQVCIANYDTRLSDLHFVCGSVSMILYERRSYSIAAYFVGTGTGSRLSTVYTNQKFVQKFAFSMPEAALFPRKLASNFWFVDFCITFYVGFGSKSGSTKAKSCGCGSGSLSTILTSCQLSGLIFFGNISFFLKLPC